MRILTSFLLVLLIIAYAQAQPPTGPVTPGTTFGSTITAADAISVTELSSLLKEDEAKGVKVRGTVTDVCPKKGCWLSLDMPGNTKVFVKMKDYGFFVPLELIGKTVVIDAEAKIVTTSVDELKHYAEDARKSEQEIAAITEPEKEVRLTANGILIIE